MEIKIKNIQLEQFEDLAGCAQNSKLYKELDTKNGEKIIFSCFVHKKNKF